MHARVRVQGRHVTTNACMDWAETQPENLLCWSAIDMAPVRRRLCRDERVDPNKTVAFPVYYCSNRSVRLFLASATGTHRAAEIRDRSPESLC